MARNNKIEGAEFARYSTIRIQYILNQNSNAIS